MRELKNSEQEALKQARIVWLNQITVVNKGMSESHKAGFVAALDHSAAQIATLTAERDALRDEVARRGQALKPFADNAEVWEENESHFTVVYCRRGVKDKPDLKITVGDLLAARRVLGE